jgi:uncharacterized membrane protein
MTLEPLMNAGPAIQIHAVAAVLAFALGLAQLALPKGVTLHRLMGWSWVTIMAVVAASSFWIHTIKAWGDWSPIHLLSIFALIMLPLGAFYARRGNIRGHRLTMLGIFAGALLIAGAFTFVPGRIMHAMFF